MRKFILKALLVGSMSVLVACGGSSSGSGAVSRPDPAAVFSDDAEALAIAQFVFGTGFFPISLSDELESSLGGVFAITAPGGESGSLSLASLVAAIATGPYTGNSDIASPALVFNDTFSCSIGNASVFIDIADDSLVTISPGDVIRLDFNGCTDLDIEGTIIPGVFDGGLEIVFLDYIDTATTFLLSIEVEFDNFFGSDGLFSTSGDGSFVLTSGFDESGSGSAILEFSAPSLTVADDLLGEVTFTDYEFVLDDDFGTLETLFVLAGCAEGDFDGVLFDAVCFDTAPDIVFDFESGFYESGAILIEGAANSLIDIVANGTDFPAVEVDFDGDGNPDSFPGWSWFDLFPAI